MEYPYSQNGKKLSKEYAMYKNTTNDEESQVLEITRSLDVLAREGGSTSDDPGCPGIGS